MVIIRPYEAIYMVFLALQIISTLFIGLYAYKGYRLLKDKRLLNIHLGFTIIGGGLLVQLILFIFIQFIKPLFYMLSADYVSAFAQMLGYLIIVIGYYRAAPEQNLNIVGPLTLIFPLMASYLGSAILTIFILYRIIVNYLITKDHNLLTSILAFSLLPVSYILLSLAVARPEFILLGNFIRLMGFMLIAGSIYRTSSGVRNE